MPADADAPGRNRGEPVDSARAYQAAHAVRALEHLAFHPRSAPELAVGLQVHPRTARRLLHRLAREQYVTLTPGPRRRYELTFRLAALGRQAIAHSRLPRVAGPWVATLAAQTGRRAGLWLPCYSDAVCILAADAGAPVPEPELGALLPAHASAPGKALLAHRQAWRDGVLSRALERHTSRTVTDPRELVVELDRIRARGYATDHGEHNPEVHALAVPVDIDSQPMAALAVSLTADRLATRETEDLAALLIELARSLGASIDDSPR